MNRDFQTLSGVIEALKIHLQELEESAKIPALPERAAEAEGGDGWTSLLRIQDRWKGSSVEPTLDNKKKKKVPKAALSQKATTLPKSKSRQL